MPIWVAHIRGAYIQEEKHTILESVKLISFFRLFDKEVTKIKSNIAFPGLPETCKI